MSVINEIPDLASSDEPPTSIASNQIDRAKLYRKRYYLKCRGVDVMIMTEDEILNYKGPRRKYISKFDEEEHQSTMFKLSHRRSYLKHTLGLDVSNMSVEEILSYPIKRGAPKKYETLEERKEYVRSMKTTYKKTYHAKARVKQYYKDYYTARTKELSTCPHCKTEFEKNYHFLRHLSEPENMACKLKEQDDAECLSLMTIGSLDIDSI